MQNKMVKEKCGFTLLEVLVAISVVIIGATGAFAVLNWTATATLNMSAQLVASYLAQEGIEIVRNIRDTNFLAISKGVGGVVWTDGGLEDCEPSTGCEADYDDSLLLPFVGQVLLIDPAGFYNYDVGDLSPLSFRRKILVEEINADKLEVAVEVTWEERGRTNQVKANTELYNWIIE